MSTETQSQSHKSVLEIEAAALEKRWPCLKRVNAHFFTLLITSSSPDLPIPCSSISVECALPDDYPSTPAKISLVSCDDLPLLILSRMNELLQAKYNEINFNGKVMIRDALRWLENTGINETLTKVIKEQEREHLGEEHKQIPLEKPQLENSSNESTILITSTSSANPLSEIEQIFASQHSWEYSEHRAFEDALNDLIIVRGRNVLSSSFWKEISRQIVLQTSKQRSPEECLARFLTLRKLCTLWMESSIHRPTVANEANVTNDVIGSADNTSSSSSSFIPYEIDKEEISFQQLKGSSIIDNRFDMFGRKLRETSAENENETTDRLEETINKDEDKDEDLDDDDEDNNEDEEDYEDHGLLSDDTFSAPPLMNIDLSPKHSGAMLIFDRLSIVGVGTFAASRVLLLLQCERCNAVVSASLAGAAFLSTSSSEQDVSPDTELKQWCAKCSLLLTAKFRPTLLHLGNASLGYVDTTHASVTTLIHSSFIATCLECGAASEIPKFQAPQTWETSCRTCFNRLRIDVRGSRIEQAELSTRPNLIVPRREEKMTFTPGQPLPDRGTCDHYRRSYRWLRFPCCEGKAFPCDTCHDEASDHPHEWAKRMICGHCAKEQPFSNLPCVSCGGAFRRGGEGTRFWQGGSGQRNQELLSRNDSRKHSENKLKTHSKKATRVGSLKSRQAATVAPRTFERYRNGEVETVVVKERRPGK
jgi:uncharacterized CHY-type Zn-finger protein